MEKLPIGVQNCRKLREHGALYVDKTGASFDSERKQVVDWEVETSV